MDVCLDDFVAPVREGQYYQYDCHHYENELASHAFTKSIIVIEVVQHRQTVSEGT